MLFTSKPKEFTPRFEIVSLYLESRGAILLLHRHPHKSQGNKWGVPAGKVERGEKLTEALAREVFEETGLKIPPESPTYLRTVYVKHPEHSFTYHIFHLSVPTPPKITISRQEHQDFLWINPHKASSLALVDDLDICIQMHYSGIPKQSRQNEL